ncbi:MAG: sulfotransferase [Planctomycetota bacterium]
MNIRQRVHDFLESNTRALMGADLGSWYRVLAANRFAVAPQRLHLAVLTSGMAVLNQGCRVANRVVGPRRRRRLGVDVRGVFVIGHWRTGTTLLHELLTCDPRNAYPTTWDCLAPHLSPWLSERGARLLPLRLPRSRPFDNMRLSWDSPQEDEFALLHSGASSTYQRFSFPRTNQDVARFLELAKAPGAGPLVERFLHQVAWVHQRRRASEPADGPIHVVMKSPTHCWRVDELRRALPNARFIHITRDPYAVFPSTRNLWVRLCGHQGFQSFDFESAATAAGLDRFVLEVFKDMHTSLESQLDVWRAEDPEFDQRYVKVAYESLDPTVEENTPSVLVDRIDGIYDQLGLHRPSRAPGLSDVARERLTGAIEARRRFRKNRFTQLEPELVDAIDTSWGAYFRQHGYAHLAERALPRQRNSV